jgi:hypothetical protein
VFLLSPKSCANLSSESGDRELDLGELTHGLLFIPVGTSYVVTRFATAPESLLVYYTITDRSASARIPL